MGRSSSAFVLCAGVSGRTEGIAHHNVWWPLDPVQEQRYLDAGQVPIDPTIHATVSAVTDRTVAGRDRENWYILVQVPSSIGLDRKIMTAAVLNRLAERGVDLRDRIEFTRTLLPADIEVRYRSRGGSIGAQSSNSRTAMFDRPDNVGPVDGLFLVGASARPGPGLVQVVAGAGRVAALVAARGS